MPLDIDKKYVLAEGLPGGTGFEFRQVDVMTGQHTESYVHSARFIGFKGEGDGRSVCVTPVPRPLHGLYIDVAPFVEPTDDKKAGFIDGFVLDVFHRNVQAVQRRAKGVADGGHG